jgi:hypothetical protein
MLLHRAAGRGWRLSRAPCCASLSTLAVGSRAGLRLRSALAPPLQQQRSQLARTLGAPPPLQRLAMLTGPGPLRIGRAQLRSRAGAPPSFLAVLAPKDAADTAAAAVGAKSADGAAAPVKQKAWLVRTWEYIKHEAHHYYMGTILLYKDVRTAVPLLQRLLLGHDLSRREHNLLVRVVADMTRSARAAALPALLAHARAAEPQFPRAAAAWTEYASARSRARTRVARALVAPGAIARSARAEGRAPPGSISHPTLSRPPCLRQARAVRLLRDRALHGVPAAHRAARLPGDAALDLRDQV